VGVVAALLYLGALPAVGGLWVNPRQISIVLILLALLVEGPIRRGALISLAALFSQWFVLASVPITLFSLHDRSPRERLRWLAKFGITGLTLAVGSYLAVFVLYGESSLRHAVRYSVLMEYPRPHPSVFNQQIRLIGGHVAHSRGILAILLLAGYGAYDRLVSSDGVSCSSRSQWPPSSSSRSGSVRD
jgi:amino acid transporter